MASVFDVAKYILEKQGTMTVMKLQKLVYYSQAWSLVWRDKPIFPEKIQAWANGPVVRELYNIHKAMGLFSIDKSLLTEGDSSKLTKAEINTIDAILTFYGDKSAQWLSDLSHMEAPWNEARKGYPVGANCENEITLASMHEYYLSLMPEKEKIHVS